MSSVMFAKTLGAIKLEIWRMPGNQINQC